MDLALFQIRRHPVFLISTIYRKVLLVTFSLFMIFGNFSRLFAIGNFPSSVSILEAAVYGLALPVYFLRLRTSQIVVFGIVLSSIYGALIEGFDLTSSLYAFKLIGMIGSAVVISEQLKSEDQAVSFFLHVYGWIVVLGFLIFAFFPKAETFFNLLKGYGVHFHGDPHKRRFISPFFDPNFYAAIACLPLILAFWKKRWGLFFLFLTSIVLSFSRSGIATCGLVLILFLTSVKWKVSWRAVFILPLTMVPVAFPKESFHLFQRSFNLMGDPSAFARFDTFRVGLSFFWEHPFFGVGFNYLSKSFEEAFGRLSPDSSLLVTLINFGLIPFLIMIFGLVWWSINHFRRDGLFSLVYFYAVICILFSSLFNNLLYYPYWFIPVVALITRLGGNKNASCTGSRLDHPNGWGRKSVRGAD